MGACAPVLLLYSVAGHELGHQERTEGVVLLLGVEADLGGGTLRGVGHLRLGVGGRVGEEPALCKHACGHRGAGIAELTDVRLLGERVDTEIGVGVRARLAVDFLYRILENYFLILTRHKMRFYVSRV